MKYIVTRASSHVWDGDIGPCEEARKEEVIWTDEREVDDPRKLKFGGDEWYTQEGFFNHRVENGHIKRDWKEQKWVIEINSLEELNAFVEKYGDIIIENYYFGNSEHTAITIYDDYVE